MSSVERILRRMRQGRPGSVFTPADFAAIGTPHAIGMSLGRLVREGRVRRLARGLYDLPRADALVGTVPAATEAVVDALASRHRIRIQPTGAAAAHLLGLTEQVPVKAAYFTDGAARRIRIGRREIILRRASPRNLAAAGRCSGLVIQALKWLGRDHVTEETVAHLRKRISPRDLRALKKDAALAPAWVAEWLRKIAEGEK